jgi:hypothetical protein
MSRDRDRILEQALTHELKGVTTPPADAPAVRDFSEGGCLDAETLGAWSDGALNPAAVAACEAHVSNCDRCQALVGAFARGSSAVGTSGTLGTLDTPGALSFWRWWLAPIAAGVTAATLWMVVPEPDTAPPAPSVSITQQPPVRRSHIPPAVQGSGVAAETDAQARRQSTDQFARDSAANATRADQQPPKLTDERKQEQRKEEALVAEVRERVAAAESAAAPAAVAADRQAAPAAPPPAAPAIGSLQKSARPGFSPVNFEIPTLQPAVRWRVAGDFFLELTQDGGASWQRKHQVPGVNAGSAPSASVLWLGGANGTVWLTTDGGATFRNVGIAEPLDIASVSATDARTASVFTVSGRRFTTEDGGRTWRPF